MASLFSTMATLFKVRSVRDTDCNTDDAYAALASLVSALRAASFLGESEYSFAIFVTATLKGSDELANYMRIIHGVASRFPNIRVTVHIVTNPAWEFTDKGRVVPDQEAYDRMFERWSFSADPAENVTEFRHNAAWPKFTVTDTVFIDAPYDMAILESLDWDPDCVLVVGDGYNTGTKLPSESNKPDEDGNEWRWSSAKQKERYDRLLELAPRVLVFNGYVAGVTLNFGKVGPKAIAAACEELGTDAPKELIWVASPPSQAFADEQLAKALQNAGTAFEHSRDGVAQLTGAGSVLEQLMRIAVSDVDAAVDVSKQLLAASYAVDPQGSAYHAPGSNAEKAVEAMLRGRAEVELSDPAVEYASNLARLQPEKYSRRAAFNVETGRLTLADDGPLHAIVIEDAPEQQKNLLVELSKVDTFLA